MKLFILFIFCITTGSYQVLADYQVGLPAQKLVIECSGMIAVAGVIDARIHPGFFDRAGNWHPPVGVSNFKLEVQDLASSCSPITDKLGIDLHGGEYTANEIYQTSDLNEVKLLAHAKVGKTFPFKVTQNFSYQEKDGDLPFYPLLHKESLELKAEGIQILGSLYKVNVKSAYGITLSEDKRVQLSKLILKKLANPSSTSINIATLALALFDSPPIYKVNFKPFLEEALEVYSLYESMEKLPSGANVNGVLAAFGNSLATVSYQTPEFQYIDLPTVLVEHPSMLSNSISYVKKESCPNLDAKDLEETMEILKMALDSDALSMTVTTAWETPLKVISGGLWSSSENACLDKIISSKSEDIAKSLLKEHYHL